MSATLYSAKYSGSSPDNLMLAAWRLRYSSANLSNSTSSIVDSAVPIRNELHATCHHELPDARARQCVALRRPRVRPSLRRPHVLVARVAHQLHGVSRRQIREHRREIGLVEAAAEVEAYEIVAAPQVLQRGGPAEQAQSRLLRQAARVLQAAQHVAAHAL